MAFDVTPITSDIADGILAWCGVSDPTSAETNLAEIAADSAQAAIMFYRGLDRADEWAMDTDYVLYDVVRPVEATGHLYVCSTAGTSDETTRPTWPTSVGGTVTDGTVVWTEDTPGFETKYTSLAIEMGTYLYTKRGVDGTIAFSEGGVARSFEKGSFPPSMLARIALPVKSG
ncbi:MAG: hypothetical protein JRC93_04065 [Deltaproteobacteria bacterium]|nr:hypothetical protein [Deltaproteobacteria bacterium]